MTSPKNAIRLVNKAHVRRYVLDYADRTGRGQVVTHVSAETYDYLDGQLRRLIRKLVDEHPSGFRTVKP